MLQKWHDMIPWCKRARARRISPEPNTIIYILVNQSNLGNIQSELT